MSFAYPWALLWLLGPVLLGVWWRGNGERVRFPFDHHAHRTRWLGRVVLGWFHVVPLLMLGVVIVLLAGPQQQSGEKTTRKFTNIELCLDVSGSMGGGEDSPYRVARIAIEDFTTRRAGDAMGLILFGNAQIRWVPLTEDLQVIRNALPFADPERQPSHMGGTEIAAALRFASQVMEAEAKDGDRIIVLVSDGISGDIEGEGKAAVADVLNAADIRLFYLHVNATEPPEQAAMELAEMTGGRGFIARDREGLFEVFRQIDRMTRATVAVEAAAIQEAYRPWLLVLLGLGGLHMVGLLGVRYLPW